MTINKSYRVLAIIGSLAVIGLPQVSRAEGRNPNQREVKQETQPANVGRPEGSACPDVGEGDRGKWITISYYEGGATITAWNGKETIETDVDGAHKFIVDGMSVLAAAPHDIRRINSDGKVVVIYPPQPVDQALKVEGGGTDVATGLPVATVVAVTETVVTSPAPPPPTVEAVKEATVTVPAPTPAPAPVKSSAATVSTTVGGASLGIAVGGTTGGGVGSEAIAPPGGGAGIVGGGKMIAPPGGGAGLSPH